MNFGSIIGAIVLFLVATSGKGNSEFFDDNDNDDTQDNDIVIKDIVNQLPRDYSQSYNTRSLSQITQFVIHHSATTSGSAAAYANFHTEPTDYQDVIVNGETVRKNFGGRGWPGIGYHYVIDKDGTVIGIHNSLTNSTGHIDFTLDCIKTKH